MPTLQFMPWCHIDKMYSVGEITLIPFECDELNENLDELTKRQIKIILASYKNLEGRPVRKATLVQYEDRPLLADLGDDELEATRESVELACFCGLAKREYFRPGLYCNTDCFVLYGHKFSQEPDFVAITSRRCDGRTYIGRFLATTVFSVPVHVSTIEAVALDAELLDALVAFRKQVSNDEWSRWQNAIACFNQASTDNSTFRYQVEWVLLCSAFQRILRARSKAQDVAQKFANTIIPYTTLEVHRACRKTPLRVMGCLLVSLCPPDSGCLFGSACLDALSPHLSARTRSRINLFRL